MTTDGTMNVEQTRNATLTAKLADLTIKETGIVGGGSLTLNPGSENDIIVQEGELFLSLHQILYQEA